MEVILFKKRKPTPKILGVAQIRPANVLSQRRRIPVQLMAHTAHVRQLLLSLELCLDIWINDIGLTHYLMWESVLIGNTWQPTGLIERTTRTPIGGYMHG